MQAVKAQRSKEKTSFDGKKFHNKDELVNLIRFWLALQIGGWPIKILKGNNFRGIFFSYRL